MCDLNFEKPDQHWEEVRGFMRLMPKWVMLLDWECQNASAPGK